MEERKRHTGEMSDRGESLDARNAGNDRGGGKTMETRVTGVKT